MRPSSSLIGKTVFVTGGSGGLGKAISQALAAKGAHITIFARRQGPLDKAKKDIKACTIDENQEINAVSLDMSNASKVDAVFRAQARLPDELYCAVGGNHAENGFLIDIPAAALDRCMRNNYYSSAYPAKSIIDIWTEDDKKANAEARERRLGISHNSKLRRIVFVSSAAAFVSLPGSIAYTPAKVAVRALADTLRLEMLRYNCLFSKYSIHCAFPGDFISPGFYLEQDTKTPLTKRLQGTAGRSRAELETCYPSSEAVATGIIAAAENGVFIICSDSMTASLLFTNMTGPSPKRGWGILDSLVGLLVGWIVWPLLRRKWENSCRVDGDESRQEKERELVKHTVER